MSILAQQAKDYWTTHHNLSGRVVREGNEHRWALARYILDTYSPSSALEFGCGSGRNLAVIRELGGAHIDLVGIDGNAVSIESGRVANADDRNMTLIWGSEYALSDIGIGTYDVAFTCSVLDHIPDPEWRTVYDNLKRIARKAVVLLEPAKFENAFCWNLMEYDFSSVTPFTWAHAYSTHDPGIALVRSLPIYLGGEKQRFGDMYRLMERRFT